MKILLAVDGSECSDAAVDAVAKRPWPEHSLVRIICAIDPPFMPTPEAWSLPNTYYAEMEAATAQQAEMVVHKARHRLQATRNVSIETSTTTQVGRAEDVILDEAEKWGADLIVLGSHGYRGFQRFLLGSVSNAVSSHASCSVEIVRTHL